MSGIIEFKGYSFWKNIDVVHDKIWSFLTNKFSDSIIFPELFGVDFFIVNENIPVEVQSTILLKYKKGINRGRLILAHSQFEQQIEK